jgi:hypothetical protein
MGVGFTVTPMEARELSHPFTVWVTKKVLDPLADVEGVGAVVVPVPPEADTYHKSVPVTPDTEVMSGVAVLFWQ